MSMRFTSLIWLVVILIFTGCSNEKNRGKWLKDRGPEFEGQAIDVKESRLTIPVMLPLDEVQKALNTRVPIHIVQNKEGKMGLQINVSRGGAIVLEGRNRDLLWEMPLIVEVSHRLLKENIVSFELLPVFISEVRALEDYSIQSNTRLVEMKWVQPAVLNLLGGTIDITETVDKIISAEQDKINAAIDDELNKLDLKVLLKKTWTKLYNPIRINRAVQPIYLVINPTSISLNHLYFQRHHLAIELGVRGMLSTVFDSASNVQAEMPFPPLQIGSRGEEAVNEIYLPLEVSYERINEVLKSELFGLEFEVEERELRLDSINVLSVDSLMLITALISGDLSVEVELLGRPHFNPIDRSLEVADFDFHVVQIDQTLFHIGDYFFHDELVLALKEHLSVPMGTLIDTIPALIYRGVERGKSGDKINLNAELKDVRLDQMRIRYNDLGVVLFARGTMDVEVEKLK